jgi:hypothetical protein
MRDSGRLARLCLDFDDRSSKLDLLELLFLMAFLSLEKCQCGETISNSSSLPSGCQSLISLRCSLSILSRSADKFAWSSEAPDPHCWFDGDCDRELLGLKRMRETEESDRLAEVCEELRICRLRNVRAMKAELSIRQAHLDEVLKTGDHLPLTDASSNADHLRKLVHKQRKMLDSLFEEKCHSLTEAQEMQDQLERQLDQISALSSTVEKLQREKAADTRLDSQLKATEALRSTDLVRSLQLSYQRSNEDARLFAELQDIVSLKQLSHKLEAASTQNRDDQSERDQILRTDLDFEGAYRELQGRFMALSAEYSKIQESHRNLERGVLVKDARLEFLERSGMSVASGTPR